MTDQLPAQDLVAEQSLLGGMLLSKAAITDVIPVLRPGDFCQPAHSLLFEVIVELHEHGKPADAVTVSGELLRRDELFRIGGAPYLHTLIATAPTPVNATHYAEIIAANAARRHGS